MITPKDIEKGMLRINERIIKERRIIFENWLDDKLASGDDRIFLYLYGPVLSLNDIEAVLEPYYKYWDIKRPEPLEFGEIIFSKKGE